METERKKIEGGLNAPLSSARQKFSPAFFKRRRGGGRTAPSPSAEGEITLLGVLFCKLFSGALPCKRKAAGDHGQTCKSEVFAQLAKSFRPPFSKGGAVEGA